MKPFSLMDKLWRTVVGVIIMHPILIFRHIKGFALALYADYLETLDDLKRMWKKKPKEDE